MREPLNFLRWAIHPKNGQQKKNFEKKNRKENGIETKEVAFTPRDESLSYLLYTHLSKKKFSPFLLFFTWRFCCETAWKPTHYSIPVYPSNDGGFTYRNKKFLK